MTDQGPAAPPPAEPNPAVPDAPPAQQDAAAPPAPAPAQDDTPAPSGFTPPAYGAQPPAYGAPQPGPGAQPPAAYPAQPGYTQPQPQPGYAQPRPQPQPQPEYAQPQPGYPAQPGYTQPYPGYGQPQPGFAAPYQSAPVPGYAPPQAAPPGPRTLGVVALALSLVAGVIVPIVGAIAAWRIGAGIGTSGLDRVTGDAELDLSIFSPVRNDVLVAELAFWVGTILGIWAIIQGSIAIGKRRGRGFGIAAIIVAAVAPFVFFVLLPIFMGAGAAAFLPANA